MQIKPSNFLLGVLIACLTSNIQAADSDVVAKMGNAEIRVAELRQLLENQTPELRQQVQADPQALERLIRVEIMRRGVLEEAKQKAWDKTPEVSRQIEAARNQVIVTSYLNNQVRPAADYPSEAELKTAYDANKALLKSPAEYHISQIFIAVADGADKQTEASAKSKANEAAAKAREKNANFADIAKKYSEHKPSADKGGDMGWLPQDQLTPEVRFAVASLKAGEVSQVIRSQQGWHVIKLQEIKEPKQKTLDDVREALQQNMRWRKAQENEAKYLEDMEKRTPVQINQITYDQIKGKL